MSNLCYQANHDIKQELPEDPPLPNFEAAPHPETLQHVTDRRTENDTSGQSQRTSLRNILDVDDNAYHQTAGMEQKNKMPMCSGPHQMFAFYVGEMEVQYLVHYHTFSACSSRMAKLMEDGLRTGSEIDTIESRKALRVFEGVIGYAKLPEVDVDTFQRVREWSMVKKYTVPGPVLESTLPEEFTLEKMADMERESSDTECSLREAFYAATRRPSQGMVWTITAQVKPSALWEDFFNVTMQSNIVPLNLRALENCTDVFLAHAKAYVFGAIWDIEPLRLYALTELHCALVSFIIHDTRVSDVVTLLHFAYTCTVPKIGPLRELVVGYAVCVIEKLMPNKRFQALLRGGSALAVDLLKLLMADVSEARAWYIAQALASGNDDIKVKAGDLEEN